MMKKLAWLLLAVASIVRGYPELSMVVVIPSYNNKDWCRKNLTSVWEQNYKNFRVIYLDDCSSDGMGGIVDAFIEQHSHQVPCTLIHNTVRRGALANIHHAISMCEPWEIVLLLDGDDWLHDNNVLARVNNVYWEHGILFTHGLFVEYPSGFSGWSQPIPASVIKNRTFRSFKPHPSHLRTFYAELFQRIKLEHLQHEGDFFMMTGDIATVLPIAEMASERIYYFKNFTYVYNVRNPLNDNKVNAALQNYLEKVIRALPPYDRLSDVEAQRIVLTAQSHALI